MTVHTKANTHTHTCARTHACTHMHTRTHTHTQALALGETTLSVGGQCCRSWPSSGTPYSGPSLDGSNTQARTHRPAQAHSSTTCSLENAFCAPQGCRLLRNQT